MSAAESIGELAIRDVQASPDLREVLIHEVGIDDLSYPLGVVGADGSVQNTVAECRMVVELAKAIRGTHMSRFVEVLDRYAHAVGPKSLPLFAQEVLTRLDTRRARIALNFPYFLSRQAPVSGLEGKVRYEGRVEAVAESGEATTTTVGVRVPVTSLCPCSKEISDYGAHNQRGYVDIQVSSPWSAGEASGIWLEDLIAVAEEAGSAPIYSLLKRSDEREVTMQAYDNPAFVEDIVRDVIVSLREDVRVARATVAATNQESIHDHSAVAEVRWSRIDD